MVTDATVGAVGALTVTDALAETPAPVTVIMAVPCLTKVTSPDDTVAVALFDELQVSATPVTAFPDASSGTAASWVVFPGTPVTVEGARAMATTGGAVTVTASLAVTPPVDAVIVAVPDAFSVTRPLELTFAADAFDDAHDTVGPTTVLPEASLRTAVTCVVLPATPVIDVGERAIDATGAALIVAPMVAATPPADAVIVAAPCLTRVTNPLEETVAFAELDDDHVTVTPVTALPLESLNAAVTCAVLPGTPVMAVGESEMFATGPTGGVATVTPTSDAIPVADAVIDAEPCFESLTMPDDDTVATDVFDDAQFTAGGVAMVAPVESLSTAVICVELPGTPLIVAGDSWMLANTGSETVVGTESVRPPTRIPIHERPRCRNLTRPLADTDATAESVVDHATAESVTTAPDESFIVAVICVESPGLPLSDDGDSVTTAICDMGGRYPVPGLPEVGSVRDLPLKQPYVPKTPNIPASVKANASAGRVIAARM